MPYIVCILYYKYIYIYIHVSVSKVSFCIVAYITDIIQMQNNMTLLVVLLTLHMPSSIITYN